MPSLWGKLRVFSDRELYALHCQTLRVLENLGVGVYHDEVLHRLEAAGLKVDLDHSIVKFPPEYVEAALQECKLMDRRTFRPQKRLLFSAEGGPNHVIDLDTNRRREATLQDLEDAVRLADALPNIDGVGEPITPTDVHPNVWDLFMYKSIWTNTAKQGGGVMGRKGNVIHNRGRRSLEYLLELGAIMAGGRDKLKEKPIMGANMTLQSPLRFDGQIMDEVLFMLEARQYITVCGNPMGCAQAPATLAGVLTIDNAERLGGIAILKSLDPEAKIFVGNHPAYMDLRCANFSDGSPEHALLALGGHELLRYYGLHLVGHHPVMMSLDKTVGIQAAIEESIQAMLWGLMGASGVCCCGSTLYSYSLAQLVIDNEIAGMVNHILKGFDIDEEACAYDVIKEIGVGGAYFAHPHTAREGRKSYWPPELFDRNQYDGWLLRGGKNTLDIAREKAKQILSEHHPKYLTDEQIAAMNELCARAQSALVP